MRIAVVSDIHANLTALEAVVADLERQRPDLVVQGGDLISGGSRPAEVIDRVRDLNWPGVHGNTDEMVWAPDRLETALQAPAFTRMREALRTEIIPGDACRDRRDAARMAAKRCRWIPRGSTWLSCTRRPATCGGRRQRTRLMTNWRWHTVPSVASAWYSDTFTNRSCAGCRHSPWSTRAASASRMTAIRVPPTPSIDDDTVVIRRVEHDVEEEIACLVGARDPSRAMVGAGAARARGRRRFRRKHGTPLTAFRL